jgi:two-component system chemotaxis response regulator CheY
MQADALSKMRVLIVDDNLDMRVLLRRLLGSRYIRHVDEATGGLEALKMLEVNAYDLILSDLEMRPMDGLQFVREVRSFTDASVAKVPIVMVTGHTQMEKVQAARDCGVTEFLIKPIIASNLFARITGIAQCPRPFVRTTSFIGPDRRRKALPDYGGPRRRHDDH